ncbi:MAG: GntP family permease, partial [Saprospiraceae bacterium]|nr:GntP family permease [Saprospiraceae bacterium]
MIIVSLLILSIVAIVLLTARFNMHPFLALLFAALGFALLSGMPLNLIVDSINNGFGTTLGKIGMVIVLGVIIGAFLEQSGGAYKLADVVLKIIGRHRVHEAMAIIGYIVAIPVFADSGFIILSSLNKSLTKKAGLSIAGTGIALILGLMLTHVMVPPTPGPIAAAGILNADVGLVMLLGLIVSALGLVVAIVYAKMVSASIYIDPNPELSEVEIEEKIKSAPNTFKSLLPIVVPILLIVGKSIVDLNYEKESS